MTAGVAAPSPQELEWKGWTLSYHGEITSTNDLARNANPWTAVIARAQTRGRGRYGRSWSAAPGGLWVSAVLPLDDRTAHWAPLPLATGLALVRTLGDHGLRGHRLRWPNDLMIGDRKVAGLLVERIDGPRAIIGVGLNITNRPSDHDPALAGVATRLADHLKPAPDPDDLLHTFLDQLRAAHTTLRERGFAALASEMDACWDRSRPVTVTTPDADIHGAFEGVDDQGRLRVRDAEGALRTLEASAVTLFRDHPPIQPQTT